MVQVLHLLWLFVHRKLPWWRKLLLFLHIWIVFTLLHLLECCFKFILKIKDAELNGVNPSSHLCKPHSTAMTPQVSINLTSVNTFAMFWLTPVVNINPPYVLFKIDKCPDKQDHTNRNVPIPRQRATITQPINRNPTMKGSVTGKGGRSSEQ